MAYDFYAGQYNFYFDYNQYHFSFSVETIEGVEHLFNVLVIQEIFINTMVSFKETDRVLILLRTLQEIHHSDLVIPIHDYYPVCPNFTLLDMENLRKRPYRCRHVAITVAYTAL